MTDILKAAGLRLLGALVLLALALPVHAQVSEARAEALMRLSGLWEQLASLGQTLRDTYATVARESTEPNERALFSRLADASEAAYGPVGMRVLARRELAAGLQERHLPALDAYLGSEPGQRWVAAENQSAASTESTDALEKRGAEVLQASSPARRALLERVLEAARVAELGVEMQLNTLAGLKVGTLLAAGRPADGVFATERERLGADRVAMLADTTRSMRLLVAESYQGLSDADLAAYLQFLQSEAGRHWIDVMARVYDHIFARGAEETGRAALPR